MKKRKPFSEQLETISSEEREVISLTGFCLRPHINLGNHTRPEQPVAIMAFKRVAPSGQVIPGGGAFYDQEILQKRVSEAKCTTAFTDALRGLALIHQHQINLGQPHKLVDNALKTGQFLSLEKILELAQA